MRLVLVTPPAVEPLTAADVKARQNIGSEMTDDVVEAFIKAAREQFDGRGGCLGRALITQVWDGFLPCFPSCEIEIPLPPLQEVLSVRYLDEKNVAQELDPSDFQIVPGRRSYIVPAYGKSWPSTLIDPDAVTIEFVAGYGDDPEDVPEAIRTAISLQVAKLRSLSERNLFISQDVVDGVGSKSYVVGGNAGAAIDQAVESFVSGYRVIL